MLRTGGTHRSTGMQTSCGLSRSAAIIWLLAFFIPCPAFLFARSVVEAGGATEWKYVADGADPGPLWKELEFNDSTWRVGKAPLGFGDPGMGTVLDWGKDALHKPVTTWFRKVFEMAGPEADARFVLVFCVDDGAVLYVNGKEVGRSNMPEGQARTGTLASRALSDNDEGYYLRLPVPPHLLHAGRNVLAVEVHQCNPSSTDLFFDLALKPLPAPQPDLTVPPAARWAVNAYRHQHYLGPGVTIPDGYLDGGRSMKLDARAHPASGREILEVDRATDTELAADIAFARSASLQALSPLERALRLAVYIDKRTTPPGGPRWVERTTEALQKEYANTPVRIGDWLDQCHSGMCRHRALLFKILADEAGLKTALVRGNWAGEGPQGPVAAHAWNELFLDDGRRVLVDVSLLRDKQTFPEVTAPEVAGHYLTPSNAPWYPLGRAAEAAAEGASAN